MEDSSGEIFPVLWVPVPETEFFVTVIYFIDEVPTAVQPEVTDIHIMFGTFKSPINKSLIS